MNWWHLVIGLLSVASLALVAWVMLRLGRGFRLITVSALILIWMSFRYFAFAGMSFFVFRPINGRWWVLAAIALVVVSVFSLIKRGVALTVVLAMLVFAIAAPFTWIHDSMGTAHKGITSPSTTTTTKAPEPTKSAKDCSGGHNVVYDQNQGGKLISSGLKGLSPAKAQQKVLDYVAHDSRGLTVYWNTVPAGRLHPIKNYKDVEHSGCYNQLGVERYTMLTGILENANWKSDTAPVSGTNTGVTPHAGPFQHRETISGDRKGVRVDILDAKGKVVLTFWIMNRCGNVVTKTPIPGLPPKPVKPPLPTTPTTGEHGKDATKSHQNNPKVPAKVKGCTGVSDKPSGTAPCKGNTAGPPDPPDKAKNPGKYGCGVDKNGKDIKCPAPPPPTTTVPPGGPPETTPTTVEPKPIPPVPGG